MKIPKYVQELMERSSYEFNYCTHNPNYAAGYKAEVERLCKWADSVAGTEIAHILSLPVATCYNRQFAIVTIFDPVMKHIEQYIPKGDGK